MATKAPAENVPAATLLQTAKTAHEESRYDDAVNLLQSALRSATSSEAEAEIRCLLSSAYHRIGSLRRQLEVISKYDKPTTFNRLSESAQMQVLVRLGWAYQQNYDVPRAIALFNQAMGIARNLQDERGIGDCHFGLASSYRFVSEIRIARDHYMAALESYRNVGNWREIAECYVNVGNIDAREGDFQNAVQPIKQAISIVAGRPEHDLLGRAYNDLAIVYDHLGVPTKQILAAWQECISHFRQAGNKLWLGTNYNNVALKLMRLGDLHEAERMIVLGIDLLRPTARVSQLGGALDTLAQISLALGKLDEADRALEESVQIFAKVKEEMKSLNKDLYLEPQTYTTMARSYFLKGDTEKAIEYFELAIEIALRLGDRQYLAETQVWFAEALLSKGDVKRAKETIDSVRSDLQGSPDMVAWGYLARVDAKIAAANNHLALAIQLLEQSSSLFEIRENKHQRAVNRLVLAQIFEKQEAYAEAIAEVEQALAVFERIGAAIDESNARKLLATLQEKQAQQTVTSNRQHPVTPLDLASAVDGFIAQRLVQSAVSRELLLHELASIVQSLANSRGAVIFEAEEELTPGRKPESFKVAAHGELQEIELTRELDFINRLEPEEYTKHYVYPFMENQPVADHKPTKLVLHIIEPRAERFKQHRVSIAPLLAIVELGLEVLALKSKRRKARAFSPTRMLADIELSGFIVASRAMNRVLEQIQKIRSSNATVLITGESGTGKELIARAIHASSSRKTNNFIPFNCSATPRDMVESQLFGYRKGAFTGATMDNAGIIRTAENGTLFLDEVGDLPLDLQPKLLRFLQEGEIFPLGENQPTRVDVRVVAATNLKLEQAVAESKFREDLFHRLNVIRIQVPPLRERREEIPSLINNYLKLYQEESAKNGIQLAEETVDLMVVYDWPGNVRELCNVVRRLVAYSESGSLVTPESLSPEIVKAGLEIRLSEENLVQPISVAPQLNALTPQITNADDGMVAPMSLAAAVAELERRMIQEALSRSNGNIAHAAQELGVTRKGLYLKMDRLKTRNDESG
jgi:pentatricopeptide repeat protein